MMNNSIYIWKQFLFSSCIAGTLFIIIANQNEMIIPQVYSVTTTTWPTAASPNTLPVAKVVIITKNNKGNLTFKPQTLTIKPGEVFIGNNDTSNCVTNGISSNDPLSGKLFDTGIINPKGYAEFVASNLNSRKYPF